MKLAKTMLFVVMLMGCLLVVAQQMNPWDVFEKDLAYARYAGIVHQGKVLENPAKPLSIMADAKGTLSISAIKREAGKPVPMHRIKFRVAIKDYHTHTLWMYSDKVYEEIDVAELMNTCKVGDKLVFMTVDRRYRLSKHELSIDSDC